MRSPDGAGSARRRRSTGRLPFRCKDGPPVVDEVPPFHAQPLGEPMRGQPALMAEVAYLRTMEQRGCISYETPVTAPPQGLGAHGGNDEPVGLVE